MDEARVGQRGRTTRVWHEKGVRPLGAHDVGFASTRLFGAVCPARDEAVALVLPEASIAAMGLFLAEVGRRLPARPHAVLVLDQAGWHGPPPRRARQSDARAFAAAQAETESG